MHDLDRGQRAVLRAKLLLGVAGATAAASTAAFADQAPTAPPANTDKWVPYVDIGGGVGTGMTAGKTDAFVPLWQNIDSMLFASLGIGTETKDNQFENFGAGYRTKINPDWILGGYVGFDSTQLQDTNTFNQTSFGAEAMSADWDARLNAYIAGNELKGAGPDGGHALYINGTTIAVLDSAEAGYTGFDGEVGYRVFSTDDTDVRVFIGGFHFGHVNSNSSSLGQTFSFGYRDISGPKARAEATVYDLDILGNQSRFTLDGEIAHDDVRGTTGFIGATLRIPLGDIGGGAQALDELDRRMTDPERRNDTVLTRGQYDKPEPVIIYGPHVTSQPTNTLLYVTGTTTTGAGTYANPTTLVDATSRHTTNAFIVLDSHAGPIPGGATLQAGQTLVAGGETFTVEGEFSHAKFTHLFDPSATPTLIPATAGGTVLTLANNTSLYGFAIEGNFGNAIYGKNVDNVNISHITIDGTGGGRTGIDILHTVSGEENITIQDVAISNLTEDGIDLISNISDGGTSTETFKLSNVTVSNVGNYGIDISDYASAGSKITSNVSLTNVAVTNAQYTAIGVYTSAYGTGSTINQTLAISNATVTNTTGYGGIGLSAYAADGGHVTSAISMTGVTITGSGMFVGANAYGAGSTVAQTLTLSNATLTSSYNGGIALHADAALGATVTTNDTLSDVTITGPTTEGIEIVGLAGGTGSQISQTVSLSNATLSNIGLDGIYIREEAFEGATVNQSLSITGTTISNVGTGFFVGYGVRDSVEAYGAGAVATQTVNMSQTYITAALGSSGGAGMAFDAEALNGGAVAQYLTFSNIGVKNSGDGLDFTASAVDNGYGVTTAYQKVSITGATISNNSGVGIFLDAYANSGTAGGYQSQAAVGQKVSITNATLSHDYEGIDIRATVENGASVSQSLSAYGIDIDHSTYDGVRVVGDAETVGFLSQSIVFNNATGSYNEISYNGSNGVYVTTGASSGGQINQHLYFYSTNIDHNALNGVLVKNSTAGFYYAAPGAPVLYSHLQQILKFYYGSISHNGGTGISILNTVGYAAQEDQLISLYRETIDHNVGDGFFERSTVTTYQGYGFTAPTNLHSNVYIYNSDLSYNGGSGIVIESHLRSPLYISNTAYSYLQQHITVSGTTANHNSNAGFRAIAYDGGVFGDNIQYITLAGSQFAHNTGDGADFAAGQYYGPGGFGDAIQDVTITNTDFSHNTGNGLYAYAYAGGRQGRAEQHFTVSGSTFNYNGANGIYLKRVAEEGTYIAGFPCTAVQGLDGGCAFVRSTFDMIGGSANGNTLDGIYISNNASHYAAIYAASERPKNDATVYLKNVQANYNGADGFYSKTKAIDHSYVYNYLVSVGSTFDHNVGNGFHADIYAGNNSTIVELNKLFSYKGVNSASYNGGVGVYLESSTGANSSITSTNVFVGLTAQGNTGDGVTIRAFANGGMAQSNYFYYGNISSNKGNGVTLVAFGPVTQYSKFGSSAYPGTGNVIANNAGYGLEGVAAFGASQAINVYTGGNTVTGNTNGSYFFEEFLATQNVY
jgi:hypothetical protein